jgi:azurin
MTMKMMRYALLVVALLGAQSLLHSTPAAAADKTCKVEITGNDQMQYDKKEISVPADCTEVQLTLKHVGKLPKEAMGHNWVLVKSADLTAVANAGMSAGLSNSYVQPGDKRVIAHTKTVGGGESDTITFPTAGLAGQSLMYLCTFPGHNALMRGTFKVG